MFYYILLSGILGVFISHVSNLFIISKSPSDIISMIKISLMILPLQFIIGILLTYYYSKGNALEISYPFLLIILYGTGIVMSIIIQFYYFDKKIMNSEYISIFFITTGILISIVSKMKIT